VILVDANLLIYASSKTSPRYDPARQWLDAQLNQSTRVGLPWPSLLAFLRVVTNPRIYERPASTGEAWGQVEDWLGCANVWVPGPTENHQSILAGLMRQPGIRSSLVPDVHLAALAIEHGLTLCSADADFARFAGLKWTNPLQGNGAS
jgi:uncharacterized protein